MSSSIDPVTGAPTFDFGVNIVQIPFKKLPTPFADQMNIPEPGRTMFYPDDAPTTIANLAAHYDGSSQSQSVHTDGNHALLVKPIGASSGGPSPIPVISNDMQGSMGSGPGNIIGLTAKPVTTLYYASIGYGGFFSTVTHFATGSFYLRDYNTGGTSIRLGAYGGPTVKDPSTTAYAFGGQLIFFPVWPIDMLTLNGGVLDQYQLICDVPGGAVVSFCEAEIGYT